MWKVVFTPECQERFEKEFKEGKFSKEDGVVIKTWVKEMEKFGPDYIAKNYKWDDHELNDEWKGHRSSKFSFSGRIIYKAEGDVINIDVVRITPDHDYKK